MAAQHEGKPGVPMGEIFVVSDGTGETGAAAVRAVMLQFTNPWRLRIFGGVRHPSEVRRVMAQAAELDALVVFSLVEKREAAELLREAERHGLATVDLLGPLIARAAAHLKAEPRHEPGLLHGFSDDYFQRIEAVEFAVRHDDGANLKTLYEADIVLVGVSRTSKTPLTMYLAQRGYRTGNVPIVAGLDLPRELEELDRRKVFALDIDASTLLQVRQARLKSLRTSPHSRYTDTAAVTQEIDRARRLFRQHGWTVIDVSGRAVEENAAKIIELLQVDDARGA
ncbi:MAG: pyruvate, water dikinase regulatory protein [Myxococcota bacterium]|nr:kinase/pyrophosphorylase [Myxococcales bacterium]